jgi:serine/threonine protein kinase/formylglycine-generating enzyme required for sulfatase activity
VPNGFLTPKRCITHVSRVNYDNPFFPLTCGSDPTADAELFARLVGGTVMSSKNADEPLLNAIDRLADQFEREFKVGVHPRIEDYLEQYPALRTQVLAELLAMEVELRRAAGDQLNADEYRKRFQNDGELIAAVFSTIDYPVDASLADEGTMPQAIGRFDIRSILGRGGFGVVYLAHDPSLDRLVALKVPRRTRFKASEHVARFIEEARAAAKLKHASLVVVYDVQEHDGLPYIVQEYIEGQNLGDWSAAKRPSFDEIARVLVGVAEALGYAHQHGLTHCDLKLANVLMDTSGQPHVADFGLAVHESVQAFRKGEVFGTPAMMAPEQVRGESHRLDGRTDIWAIGVMLYELLVGRNPFTAESRKELYAEIQNHDPKPPRQINRQVPRELERICLKCLSKRRTERYNTTDDLCEDLLAWLETEIPSSTRPEHPESVATPPDSSTKPAIKIIPKGLRAFDAEDADFFLELLPGPRDRDGLPDSIRFWRSRIEETDPNNTFSVGLMYGPSGCGKSSLVKAGLLPRLCEDILPIYVEATAADTEVRILKQLGRHFSRLNAGIDSLPDVFAELRLTGAGRDRKVLLVLDQFEQWLHAHGGEDSNQLIDALRQCDGRHLQCIVMVRDDFWMAATRFMRVLEVRLVEAVNSASVDLFDQDHARRVLAAFGRAYGRLCEELTADQDTFLEQSVKGLAEDGKVVCVRLSLFADMMKGRPWTPAVLQHVGGTEGVGVTFLEETFSASTAPPEHRLHQKAARSVLKALMSEAGTDIRGHMRSYESLLGASGYAARPQEFVELVRILNSEVRLITPTDPEGIDSESESRPEIDSGQKYYQLTHDYLVPSLREWLTRKQRETWRGREELKLEERSGLWNAKPDNRYLPSWWEYLSIRALTDTRHWTDAQKSMMAQATRFHGVRAALGLAALVVFSLIGATVLTEVARRQQATRVVGTLETADIAQVPRILEELEPYRYWANALLEEANNRAAPDSRQKLNTSIALLAIQPSQAEYLYGRLLDAELDFGQLDAKANLVRIILDFTARYPPQGESRDRILSRLLAEVSVPPSSDADETAKERLAKRQATAAVALLRMDRREEVWPLLKPSADPRGRSYLVHLLGPSGVDFKVIQQQLADPYDPSIRRALLLSLGEFGAQDIATDDREALVNVLQEWYASDADPGLHGAVEWLLRQWKRGQWLQETNENWATEKQRREERLESIQLGFAKAGSGQALPQWYVNSQGQTMVVIPRSVEFVVGSPLTDDGRWPDERLQQRQTTGYHFAISAKTVTVDQFRRFRKSHDPQRLRHRTTDDCPVTMISWYAAAEYCNWLSDQEGLERCYVPNAEGKYDDGITTVPDFLNRTGYRLPTEEEWECACRAGTVTSRYFGESIDLLRKYCWYVDNAVSRTHEVAGLKPNDWGLFDMHGNVWTWCHDEYQPSKREKRIFRGGSYAEPAAEIRAAYRLKTDPDTASDYLGIRLARTLR